ncbi:MAG: DUF4446 family protein [Clostridia bacterium]|jgi:ABC-type lipoprotein release transport system permease subunit|nr:DUF4446 family protein [Clostridia bacterium]MCI9086498.1 DUF4446 family protein [Clostridia bacterium]NDO18296.1 DUF4446 family protein [Lachnospiraceae bacterium MD329]
MDNNTLLFIALAIMMILIVICFIMNAVNSSKISTIMDYSNDGDIIGALKDYYDKVDDLSKTVNDASDAVLMSRLTNCENDSNISLKKVGIVNFDAFDDVTGKLSFSLALLNNNNDGIILTSLYGHNSCNTYLRDVVSGETPIKLLDEEKQALEKAKNRLKRANTDE